MAKGRVLERITQLRAWIQARLRGRDLVFLGFWSDWAYLNSVFESSVTSIENALIVIVNPSDDTDLEAKAKGLWDWSAGARVTRRIVRKSASDFLDDLRKLMWINFLNRISLRANIDETEFAAIITEQGGRENHRERNQDCSSFSSQFG